MHTSIVQFPVATAVLSPLIIQLHTISKLDESAYDCLLIISFSVMTKENFLQSESARVHSGKCGVGLGAKCTALHLL